MFLSSILKLAASIPQGRRFSLHSLTASMKILQDIMNQVAAPSKAVLPPLARDALEGTWTALTPPRRPYVHGLTLEPLQAADAISNALQSKGPEEAVLLAGRLFGQMPSFHDKVKCVEALGTESLGPLFFVDDIACPYLDSCSTEKVMDEGLSEYASLAKAQKTSSMACFDATPCQSHVDMYKLLRVQIDKDLTFDKRLDIILAIGKSSFEELYHLAESLSFGNHG